MNAKTIGAVALVALAATWMVAGNGLLLSKVFSPAYEQVRRTTFEESKSYRQGMIQELQNMQFEYLQADPEHQAALASIILHRAADVPSDALTPELNTFLTKLRRAR